MKSAYEGYTFPLSQNVNRTSVRFRNRYGIELAGDLYTPKNGLEIVMELNWQVIFTHLKIQKENLQQSQFVVLLVQ